MVLAIKFHKYISRLMGLSSDSELAYLEDDVLVGLEQSKQSVDLEALE